MASTASLVPPLLPGQRLTREEFLARWDALPDLKNAELIDGIVYMASPVSRSHSVTDGVAHYWLVHYASRTPGCEVACNGTWLLLDSAPQPDAALYLLPKFGGRCTVTEKNYGSGPPELAVEVCASPGDDFGPKLALYQRAGVQEYITVTTAAPGEVIWRELVNGSYVTITPGEDGILRSRVFPGLWLDPSALLACDGIRIRTVLDAGLASPEHTAFAERLRATAALH